MYKRDILIISLAVRHDCATSWHWKLIRRISVHGIYCLEIFDNNSTLGYSGNVMVIYFVYTFLVIGIVVVAVVIMSDVVVVCQHLF